MAAFEDEIDNDEVVIKKGKRAKDKGKAIKVDVHTKHLIKRKWKDHEYIEIDTDDAVNDKPKAFAQRIPPRDFMNKVLNVMPDTHKDAVRNIGFGGLLDLDLGPMKTTWNEELVRSVDIDNCSILVHREKEIKITDLDVHIVYGLPMGGRLIEEPEDDVDDEGWQKFLRSWRSTFGLSKGSPLNSQVISKIVELMAQPVCDQFLWHFLVCAVNCCIRSTTNPHVRYKFLFSCMDLNNIRNLNWCEFVKRSLLDATGEYQDGSSYYTGPLPFLMVIS